MDRQIFVPIQKQGSWGSKRKSKEPGLQLPGFRCYFVTTCNWHLSTPKCKTESHSFMKMPILIHRDCLTFQTKRSPKTYSWTSGLFIPILLKYFPFFKIISQPKWNLKIHRVKECCLLKKGWCASINFTLNAME